MDVLHVWRPSEYAGDEMVVLTRSEPELTQSMSEMRKWADDAAKIGDMLDFNPHAQAAFRRWLAEKYDSIDKLNVAWNRNYQSFDEADSRRLADLFAQIYLHPKAVIARINGHAVAGGCGLAAAGHPR